MNINLEPNDLAKAMGRVLGAAVVLMAFSGSASAGPPAEAQPAVAAPSNAAAMDADSVTAAGAPLDSPSTGGHSHSAAAAGAAPKAVGTSASSKPTTILGTSGNGLGIRASNRDWGLTGGIQTSIGAGTFVLGEQNNPFVVTSFSVSAWYKLAPMFRVFVSLPFAWYAVSDNSTPLDNNDFLVYDLGITLMNGQIAYHEKSGARLTGSFRVGLPTSLASRYQNRLFTFQPSFTGTIPAGPVTFAMTVGFGKYFNSTSGPTLDCDDWSDPSQCLAGRDPNPSGGFESERLGPEVWVPGAGANSFYTQLGLAVNWAIADGLRLNLSVNSYSNFGVRYYHNDTFQADNASEGRTRTDRLISSLSLSYQIIKQIAVSTSVTSDTTRLYGGAGDSFVPFDFTTLSGNAISWNFGIRGTLL